MGYFYTRKHADGRVINAKGETVGRWDDNEDGIRQWWITKGLSKAQIDAKVAEWRAEWKAKQPKPEPAPGPEPEPAPEQLKADPKIVKTVRGYYESNKDKPHRKYGINWFRVLMAFGVEKHDELTPFTAAEAREEEKKWSGWRPVRKELERITGKS